MFPSQSVALDMKVLTDVKDYYELPAPLWNAFIQVAGDPGDDLKLLAILPQPVVAAALERAVQPDGAPLSAVQASHVGMVYNLAKRIIHVKGGGDWDNWKNQSPFMDQREPSPTQPGPTTTNSSPIERKLKMTQVIDQADNGEFLVATEEIRSGWYQRYLEIIGGWPQEEEDPSVEQVSALQRRIQIQDQAPYVDFGVWVPYGQRAMKAAKFRSYVLTASGYVTRELPGPSTFVQWRTSFRILRTALIMLDAASLAALHNYEMAIEKMTRNYPTAWHLIYAADELARSAHSNRVRARVQMDVRAGKSPPSNWDPKRPWDYVFTAIAADKNFWHAQVHAPALTWLAAGSRGTPKTPAEQLATAYMTGGVKAITPQVETDVKEDGESYNARRRPRPNKRRRGEGGGGSDNNGGRANADDGNKKGSGKTKQKCFAWNNGNGPCANLPPGQACAAKVKREHKCTICNSPGHPSMSCPNKEKK